MSEQEPSKNQVAIQNLEKALLFIESSCISTGRWVIAPATIGPHGSTDKEFFDLVVRAGFDVSSLVFISTMLTLAKEAGWETLPNFIVVATLMFLRTATVAVVDHIGRYK